jgi:hypothetical protein
MHNPARFFATIEDLLPQLQRANSKQELGFARAGSFDSSDQPIWALDAFLEVPGLGKSQSGKASSDQSFLIFDSKVRIRSRSVSLRKGGVRYCFDQAENPNTLVFSPGGIYEPAVLVGGAISTLGATHQSLELFRWFSREITRGFVRVASYPVGPNALRLLRSNFRLVTMGFDQPTEYDLKE